LWIYILSLLTRGRRYAYKIPDEIEQEFGWRPARITGYIVLRTLEMRGLVKSVEEKGDTGKIRKYYEITDKGRELLEEAREVLRETYRKLFGEEIEGERA